MSRIQRLIDRGLFHLLLGLAVALAAVLSTRYHAARDLSDTARNTLSDASRQLLATLDAPLEVRVFIPRSHPLKVQIAEVLARYRRVLPDMTIEYVDPDTDPGLARELGVAASGELRIRYKGREETLRTLGEEQLSNALQRLSRGGERVLLFLEGHGERSLSGAANDDLGSFGEALAEKGYPFLPIRLTTHPAVPDNAALLMVAGPRVPLLAAETARVLDFLERGGNLLWLSDPGGTEPVAGLDAALGVSFLAGTVVDASGAGLGLDDPRMAVAAGYPPHAVTAGFQLVTLFPQAAALEPVAGSGWTAQPLVLTHADSWNEAGTVEGRIAPDRAEERTGPLTLGLALTRQRGGREQRVVVMGDGDFLSNAYLGNGGNLDLGLNLVRWLAADDALLEIPARSGPDRVLQLSRRDGLLIAALGLGGIPLLLFATGLAVWRRRGRG